MMLPPHTHTAFLFSPIELEIQFVKKQGTESRRISIEDKWWKWFKIKIDSFEIALILYYFNGEPGRGIHKWLILIFKLDHLHIILYILIVP